VADWATYQGRFLHAWKVAVCLRCLATNPKGIAANHPAFLKLTAAGIPITPDVDGNVPWPDYVQEHTRETNAKNDVPRRAADDQ
jgi:hypothetical protein